MRKFNLLALIIAIFLTACNSSHSTTANALSKEIRVCPQCNMELAPSNIHSAYLQKGDDIYYFDDIGCMVLWSHDNNVDTHRAKVFSLDTHKYIDAASASYTMGEKTPMSYGFSAYEKSVDGAMDFDEISIKILRGEHMANPKIRKQVLGY